MYVYIRISIHECIEVHVLSYMNAYMHACMNICMNAHSFPFSAFVVKEYSNTVVHTHACIHKYMHACMHTASLFRLLWRRYCQIYGCIPTHIYIHIYIHTYMHACTQLPFFGFRGEGIVKFTGACPKQGLGMWVGLEMFDPVGMHNGMGYFQCRYVCIYIYIYTYIGTCICICMSIWYVCVY